MSSVLELTRPEVVQFNPRQRAWEREQRVFRDIAAAGGMLPYAKRISELNPRSFKSAFENDGIIVCADERVEGAINNAGSMSTLAEHKREDFVKKSGARGIAWHTGCAAAGADYRELHGLSATEQVDPGMIDQHAKQVVLQFAEKFGLEFFGKIEPGHVRWHGSTGDHFTRVLYWQAAGPALNTYACPGLPAGFTVTSSCLDREDALAETELLSGVALGSHGFGELFSPEEPFYLVALAKSLSQLEQEKDVLREHFKGEPRIAIDGFLAA